MTNRSDDFNRTGSTLGTPSDAGSDWVQPGGYLWATSAGQARNTGGEAASIVFLESGISDCDVQVTIAVVGTFYGLGARYVDAANNLLVQATASAWSLYEQVAGGYNLLGSYSAVAPANNDVLRLNMNGTALAVYINGASRITATSANFTSSTKHGLRTSGDTTARFSAFSIAALGGGGPTLSQLERRTGRGSFRGQL